MRRRSAQFALLLVTALVAFPSAARAAPIPDEPNTGGASPPAYLGQPATPRRLGAPQPPRHPFMAPNGRSNLHNDGYQSDSYWTAGPLGRDMEVRSTFLVADCASVTFDSRGRIVSVCVGLQGPRLVLLDPGTLATLATMPLPPRIPGGGNLLTDFSGGGYFYLDNRDRAVVSTTTRHLYVVRVNADPGFALERNYDLSGAVPFGDKIISALPDWSGRIWFATVDGRVGTLETSDGAVRVRALGEEIANSFAIDDGGGVYVVTTRALYRFDPAGDGAPSISWRQAYRNSGIAKPGQVGAGSGTTPTVMSKGRVAITDNADPMNVVVYHRARNVSGSRLVCEQPVFGRGASATDQSLIAAGNSLIVENNYGYKLTATEGGKSTTPGLERVDVGRAGRCRTVWHSSEIAPSVVPKLSVETGLVYTYTKPARGDDVDPWYFTALDFCTGRMVFKQLSGTGLGHNNHYAPVSIGPDGTAYVGALSGLQLFRDRNRPSGPPASAPRGCNPRPRLVLRLRYRRAIDRRGRTCARARVRARLVGRDKGSVRRVAFWAGRGRHLLDRRPPFSRLVQRRRGKGHSRLRRVHARVRMRDGRLLKLKHRYRACRDG